MRKGIGNGGGVKRKRDKATEGGPWQSFSMQRSEKEKKKEYDRREQEGRIRARAEKRACRYKSSLHTQRRLKRGYEEKRIRSSLTEKARTDS